MGVGASNPVDDSTKAEIQELIKKLLGTFTVQYTKEYALALVEKIKIEANEKPEDWQLLERPVSCDAPKKTDVNYYGRRVVMRRRL
jgi:hypothetical protein